MLNDAPISEGRSTKNGEQVVATRGQFGNKAREHCKDFGLDVSNKDDRDKLKDIIQDILQNYDEDYPGVFRGQGEKDENRNRTIGPVHFFVKGEDVVMTSEDGNRFISILKGGAKTNDRVKGARKKHYRPKGR